ncbi:MAG: hypothetical protein AB1403_20665, partial [Candidatus Riflebacteria bacterium]
MKIRYVFIALALLLVVYGQATAGCGSCEAKSDCSSCSEVKTDCPDGTCAATETADHKHDHAGDKNDEAKTEEKEHFATINTQGLKTMLDSGVPLIVLDARSGKYDDGTRIPGALSLNAES